MSELVRVAVDAMGGDHAPEAVVQGVVDALNASKEIEVLLGGVIRRLLRSVSPVRNMIKHVFR